MTSLHIKTGPLAGERIEVQGDLIIGRESSDLTIDDGDVSRRHAIVRRIPDGIEIEDLGSKNGTFVDGRRIDGPTRIAAGARLELGGTMLEVEAEEAEEATVSAKATTTAAAPAGGLATAVAAPAQSPPAPAARPGTPAAPLAPLAAPSTSPIGVFHPPARRRGRLATRSLVPVVLSFGTSVLTAVALVLYFAMR